MLSLLIGDPHYTPEHQKDCEALLGFIYETVCARQIESVVFMGDQYHSHNIIDTRGVEFWSRWFTNLQAVTQVVALVGNHDLVSPTSQFPHAMIAHPNIKTVDVPQLLYPGIAAMPYYPDPVDFLRAALALYESEGHPHTLLCHQTFYGAQYHDSFYAKDGVDPGSLPFKKVISGHIHKRQDVGQVTYVGSPRWMTKTDANEFKFISLVEHSVDSLTWDSSYATGKVCRMIWAYDDRPDAPILDDDHLDGVRATDDIRFSIYGTPTHVRERQNHLRARFPGCKTRLFIEKARRTEVSESLGVEASFEKFTTSFVPPFGSPIDKLKNAINERMKRNG